MNEPKTITVKRLAVTFTDTSHVAFAGGDPARRVVIIDLTPEQQKSLEIVQHGEHRYEHITQFAPVEP